MIILQCVKENSKLRVKFYCFINNTTNNIFTNVYNNNYNCMFPKEIRTLGTFYKVNDGDIKLATRSGTHYYSIKRQHIMVMPEAEKQRLLQPPAIDLATIQIFDAGDCVICLSSASSIVFLPCAHRCLCTECNTMLKTTKYDCPVCRVKIESNILL